MTGRRFRKPRRGRRAGSVDIGKQAIIEQSVEAVIEAVQADGYGGPVEVGQIIEQMVEARRSQGKQWTQDTAVQYLVNATRKATDEDGNEYRVGWSTEEEIEQDGTVQTIPLDSPILTAWQV